MLEALGSSAAVPGPATRPSAPDDAGIVAALVRAPASLDELAAALGQAPETLALSLLDLEIEGRVARDRDGRFRLVS